MASDLQAYVKNRKEKDPEFASGYDTGYEEFKEGVMREKSAVKPISEKESKWDEFFKELESVDTSDFLENKI